MFTVVLVSVLIAVAGLIVLITCYDLFGFRFIALIMAC